VYIVLYENEKKKNSYHSAAKMALVRVLSQRLVVSVVVMVVVMTMVVVMMSSLVDDRGCGRRRGVDLSTGYQSKIFLFAFNKTKKCYCGRSNRNVCGLGRWSSHNSGRNRRSGARESGMVLAAPRTTEMQRTLQEEERQ
jgi:hypothetical protein